jgi:hypothetical protein
MSNEISAIIGWQERVLFAKFVRRFGEAYRRRARDAKRFRYSTIHERLSELFGFVRTAAGLIDISLPCLKLQTNPKNQSHVSIAGAFHAVIDCAAQILNLVAIRAAFHLPAYDNTPHAV